MKIHHLTYNDINGGAARAAYRIHQSLRRCGVDSTMMVNLASSDDWTVTGPASKWRTAINRSRAVLGGLPVNALKTENAILHSPAILPSCWPQRLNASDADLVHLHWINGEMMSISDVGKLRKPLVWTLHDMWAFCGAEHYTEDLRWREGYERSNRPNYESGFDLNRWTWLRKLRHWKRPLHIVTPSIWLGDCARNSALMRNWPVTVIPHAIDTNVWKPVDQGLSRKLLQLPPDVPLLLFGAIGGTSDLRKGFDLLRAGLASLSGQGIGLELVIFGQTAPKIPSDFDFPVHYTGHLHDDLSLRVLYSTADLIVVPSRQEAFGQTASEALACGTPAVAFNNSGLANVIVHKKTGYLAQPLDSEDLACGIQWVLENVDRHAQLRREARARAVREWSYDVISERYCALYMEVVNKQL